MAGPTLGASASASSPLPPQATTRTKRLHGAFPFGEARFIVASSRQRPGDGLGVLLGAGTWHTEQCLVTARCTPHQARVMARALLEAADAFEAGQRQPHFTRATGEQGGAA